MARGWNKFGLLLWKNWVLQKRQVIQTCVEILVPIILAIVLVIMRKYIAPKDRSDALSYKSFPVEIPQVPYPPPWPYDRSWTIAWAPNKSAALRYIMEETGVKMRMNISGFETEGELNSYLTSKKQTKIMNTTLAGVIFRDHDEELFGTDLPKNLTIRLRFPGESRVTAATIGGFMNHASDTPSKHLSWWTQFLFQFIQMPGPRYKHKEFFFGGASPGYAVEGFLSLQQAITTSVIESRANITEEDMPELRLQRFPYPAFSDDVILQALQLFLPLIIMLSFVYSCISTVKVITTEKEMQLKEAMKIMGLPNWLHWTAWFIKCFGFLAVTAFLIVILLKVSWYPDQEGGSNTAVFLHSDPSVLFVFLLFYVASVITFSFRVSVHFSKANIAATVAGLLWFLTFAPYTVVQIKYPLVPLGGKLAACLIGSNTAMGLGIMLILVHEGTGVGAQWHNIWSPGSPDDNLFLGHLFIMMVVNMAIDLISTIYVEAVFPGEFGVPQPWYFPFTRTYWCGSQDYDSVKQDSIPAQKMSCEIYEPEPTHLPAGIQIRYLNKTFKNKTAVNDLNLNMYEGQITVLLGHNGAGKTTTMSMLTGMITPTSGTAFVSGYDVRTKIQKVRESLGLCPQHNILFEELTVREHLYFFGKLKGMDGQELEEEITKYIKRVDLIPKEHNTASTLSGGMKRKLSACVALCGKSKVVMFDEPTSGMDPTARRFLWDLLQAEKKGRTMLLTTHFMDEADLLGDRIAIMAGGDLQCVGSSFYLKKKYGEGYRLVIVKGAKCDVTATTELLRKFVPDLNVSQNIGTELSYLLRDDLSPIFEQMFKSLEDHKDALGILSYGVSLTTMEEVFMKAGADKDADQGYTGAELAAKTKLYADEILTKFVDPSYNVSTTALDMDISGTGIPLLTGFALSKNQLFAMFMKKAIYTKRTWGLFMLQVFLCLIMTISTFITAIVFRLFDDLPPRTITLESYGEYYTTVSTDTNVTASLELYEKYKKIYSKGLIELPFGANYTEFILDESVKDLPRVTQHFIVGATFDDIDGYPTVNAWFNNQPFHSPPLTMNMVYNTILKNALGDDHEINIVNHPLPFADNSKLTSLIEGDNIGFQVAFNLAFAMAFLSAFYVLFAIRERVSKAKLLQFVSGVEVLTFWGSALVWDLATFLVPTLGILTIMACFQENNICSLEDLSQYFVIMMSFAWAMMPLMYLLSFLFTIPTTGYTRITMAFLCLGCAMFMLVTLVQLPGLNLKDKADIVDQALIYVPHYNLAVSVKKLYSAKTYSALCLTLLPHCETQHSPCCREASKCGPLGCFAWVESAFSFEAPGINTNLLVFIAEGFGFIFVLLVVEFKVLDRILELVMRPCRQLQRNSAAATEKPEGVEDFDVAKERFRVRDVQRCRDDAYTLLLRDVTKYYGAFLAVDQLCVGVRRGECFGLLGVNGAGKTSTFKMLTGDEKISAGDAFVNNLSLQTNMKQVHQLIGYCPQFDALIDDLTGRETLTMFCLLRGIPLSETRFIIEQLASDLLLTKHIDKKIKEYSGGNKRKLSTAVALVGDPPVVYLDEPTTGMDPMAKRHLWNVICKVRDSGKVIVLTSHSMEECEALCTRSAIMVNGRFKCLGSTQHLKNKFAEGYTLTVKVKRPPGDHVDFGAIDMEPIRKYVLQAFPGSVQKEEHQGLMMFSIKNPTLTWARMFGMMEKAKQEMSIEDYSLGQTSLEQVFLAFTRTQREEFATVVPLE